MITGINGGSLRGTFKIIKRLRIHDDFVQNHLEVFDVITYNSGTSKYSKGLNYYGETIFSADVIGRVKENVKAMLEKSADKKAILNILKCCDLVLQNNDYFIFHSGI